MSREPGRQTVPSDSAAMGGEAVLHSAGDLPSAPAPIRYENSRCACSHLVSLHEFKPATKTLPDRRGECSHTDAKGPCPCKGPR